MRYLTTAFPSDTFMLKIKSQKIKTLVLFFAHRPYDLFCSNSSLTPIISESIPRLAELEYNINHHYESLTTTSPTVTQSGTDFNEIVTWFKIRDRESSPKVQSLDSRPSRIGFHQSEKKHFQISSRIMLKNQITLKLIWFV